MEVRFEAEERVDVAWPTVAANHADEDALEVMDMVVDNAQAGLVNLRLNQAQRVKGSGSFPTFYNDAGDWTLWAMPKQGQTLEQAEALLMEIVAALKAGDFTDEDVRAVITDFEVSEKRKLESNEARGAMLAEAFASGEPWPRAVDKLERLRTVTKADVVRVAKKYLGDNRVVAYRRDGKAKPPSIGKPAFTKVDIDPKRESAFYREVLGLQAKPLEPRYLEAGKDYLLRQEPWGRLYASSNPLNDLFSLTFVFDRGRKHERTLCEALQLLDFAGAGALSGEDFKRKLYGLGSAMTTGCGEQEVVVHLSGLEKNYDATLALAKERLESPRVDTDTLKKMIEVQLGQREDNKKNQGYVFFALSEFARRGAESAVLTQLSNDELRRLDEAALERQVRELFAFKRDVLYSGVRDPGLVELSLAWGPSPWKEPPPHEPIHYRRVEKTRLLFMPREQVQSNVGLFAADEVYDPKRSVDYLFYNMYMGGSMSGVIFQEIREARALAYSSSGGYGTGERSGDENLVWGSLGTQADKTEDAAALLHALLRETPLSEARFGETRKAVEEDFRTNIVHFREIPGVVRQWELRGLHGDPRRERFERVLGYRPADLEGFAMRFKDRVFTVYVLGDPARVDKKALSSLGELRELKLSDLFPY